MFLFAIRYLRGQPSVTFINDAIWKSILMLAIIWNSGPRACSISSPEAISDCFARHDKKSCDQGTGKTLYESIYTILTTCYHIGAWINCIGRHTFTRKHTAQFRFHYVARSGLQNQFIWIWFLRIMSILVTFDIKFPLDVFQRSSGIGCICLYSETCL